MPSPRGNETLAERLEWLIRSLGIQQKQFAHDLGISPSLCNNWLQGYSRPTIDGLAAIYETYGIGPDFLLLGLTSNLSPEWRQRWELRL